MGRKVRFVTKHDFSPWRHGGWYVTDVVHPSGAVGCVSNAYADGKWRIVCGRPHGETFATREAAADAEAALAEAACAAVVREALAAGASFEKGKGRHCGAVRAVRGETVTPWCGREAWAARAFLKALDEEHSIHEAVAAGAAFEKGPEGFRTVRRGTVAPWRVDKLWAARDVLDAVAVEDAVAAGAEFVEGCGQVRAGRGAIATPWLATRGHAALAFLALRKEGGAASA